MLSRGATLSADGRYRYRLWRRWDRSRPVVAFVMLNPSTADARRDDPTIRRCIGFARSWGFGGLEVVNLFALRATDPRGLRRARDPIGSRNARFVRAALSRSSTVVLAWGADPLAARQPADMRFGLSRRRLRCLGLTRAGQPRHPLYLPRSARLVPFRSGRRSAA